MPDDRFCPLMSQSTDKYFLRLSPMRVALQQKFPAKEPDHRWMDRLLYKVGRTVFESAWHEDQKPGVFIGKHFAISAFQPAIELLYFALSADLCSIRTQVDEEFLNFFTEVYPHEPIHRFLKLVTQLNGAQTDKVPQKILPFYSRLSQEFGNFLKIQVPWGKMRQSVPLFKLIFGNFNGRLKDIGRSLRTNSEACEGISRLEREAKRITEEILQVSAQ